MARTGQPAVRHVAAVERAFTVLDALSDGGELGTNEIARRTGINASTVSRLLATLASARFVEHVPESGRYRLSLRLIELGNAVLGRLDLRALARPHLQALVRETGETATLSAPGEHDAITVDFAHSSSVVQSVAQLGRPSVGPRDGGRQGDARVRRRASFPREPFTAYTARTITTRAALVEELARVRERGFADAREEREEGLAAIAAPVWDSRGELAGIIGVQGPASRFDAAAAGAAVPMLLEHAVAVSTELGWRDPQGRARRRQPDEAGRTLADTLRPLRVRASPHPLAIRADDEESGHPFGDELEQGVDRTGATQAQPLDVDRERVRELGGLRAARPRPPACRRTRTSSRARSGRSAPRRR